MNLRRVFICVILGGCIILLTMTCIPRTRNFSFVNFSIQSIFREKVDSNGSAIDTRLDKPEYRHFFDFTAKFGLKKFLLSKKLGKPRPLYNFTMQPWAYVNRTSKTNATWSNAFIIASANGNKLERKAIRETWASDKARNVLDMVVVFMVGATKDEKIQQELFIENSVHGDLLQVDKEDLYKHFTHKSLAGLQWSTSNFPPHWIYALSGDDVSLNVLQYHAEIKMLIAERQEQLQDIFPNVALTTEQVLEQLPIYCTDALHRNAFVRRNKNNKFYISVEEYPLIFYPPYCSGAFYTMPLKTAAQIYEKSRTLSYCWMEDTWVTGVLRLVMQTENGILLSKYEKQLVNKFEVGIRRVFTNPPALHIVNHAKVIPTVKQLWKIIEQSVLSFKG